MNPKDLAIDLLRPYIERGETGKQILNSCLGSGSREVDIMCNPKYVWDYAIEKLLYKAKPDEVVVQYPDDRFFVFKMSELEQSILSGQLSMF